MKLILKICCSVLLVASATHCSPGAQPTNFFQAPGTKSMAARLEKIARELNSTNSLFFSAQRVEAFRAGVETETNSARLLEILPPYAVDLLNAGRTKEAILALDRVEKLARESDPSFLERNDLLLRTHRAVAHLRLGEQENCLAGHNVDSCLMPIRGGGVHKLQRGSRAAIEILTNTLAAHPGDLTSRWLLNIAYMTVGDYPDKVPAQWLIPTNVFASDYDIKRFTDVAGIAGLDVNELSGGSIMEDFDGDGLLDIMESSIGLRDQMRFFHNNGDGTFAERTREAGLLGEVGGLNLIQTDYNNDGHADVLVLRGAWFGQEGRHPNSLLRNNGNGTFSDVTEEAGLLSFYPTQTAVWFDYNGDGWIDLFIGNESRDAQVHPCELFRNNGDGTFTECATNSGVANIGFVKGVISGDYNNDGRPDLYLSRKGQPNVLYRNDGPVDPAKGARSAWKFTDTARSARVTQPLQSFTTWFWDYNNDGLLDLFVGGYGIRDVGDVAADYLGIQHPGERARLFRNNGDGTFRDVTRSSRLFKVIHMMGGNFGDLDNDGFLDFYAGTGDPNLDTLIPNRMFRNAEGELFQEVTTSGGFGHLQKGHAVSFGDIDNDGDQDVHEDMGGAFSGDTAFNVLFLNPGHGNHWITLKLEGTQSNRAAIGARIKIIADTPRGSRQIFRTVGSGGSFGANPLRQEIGLGDATAIQRIEVSWPATGKVQVFERVAMDKFYKLTEGNPKLTELALKSFKFPVGKPAGHEHHHHE